MSATRDMVAEYKQLQTELENQRKATANAFSQPMPIDVTLGHAISPNDVAAAEALFKWQDEENQKLLALSTRYLALQEEMSAAGYRFDDETGDVIENAN